MNIILTGMRGSGKTAIAKKLASSLNKKFIDLDELIASNLDTDLCSFVKQGGWEAFRKAEKEAVESLADVDDVVIATGGGTLMNADNTEILKKQAKIILLLVSVDLLAERLQADTERPALLKGNTSISELEIVWQQRKNKYMEVADLIYESDLQTLDKEDDLEHKVGELKELLKEK